MPEMLNLPEERTLTIAVYDDVALQPDIRVTEHAISRNATQTEIHTLRLLEGICANLAVIAQAIDHMEFISKQ